MYISQAQRSAVSRRNKIARVVASIGCKDYHVPDNDVRSLVAYNREYMRLVRDRREKIRARDERRIKVCSREAMPRKAHVYKFTDFYPFCDDAHYRVPTVSSVRMIELIKKTLEGSDIGDACHYVRTTMPAEISLQDVLDSQTFSSFGSYPTDLYVRTCFLSVLREHGHMNHMTYYVRWLENICSRWGSVPLMYALESVRLGSFLITDAYVHALMSVVLACAYGNAMHMSIYRSPEILPAKHLYNLYEGYV